MSANTSRQRVLDSINHRQPSKVAVDFGGHRSSGISAVAYVKLRKHLGLEIRPPRVLDMVQQIAVIDDDVLDLFGIDVVELGHGFCAGQADWKPWRLSDGSDCLIPAWVDVRRRDDDWLLYSPSGKITGIQKAGALYFEPCYWPLMDREDYNLADLPACMPDVVWTIPGPPGPAASDPASLASRARAFRQATGRAIVGLFGGNLMEWGQFLFRNDNWYMLLAAEPRRAHAVLDRLVEVHLANLELFLGTVGPHIDVINFGDDLGMQSGPQISPAMYREFFKPRHATLWRRAKELAGVKVMLHCCGGVRQLMDDFIDAGLDIINPVQTNCQGMEPRGLKRDFGSRLCFWGGGCDTREILPHGTPGQIRDHVLERLEILAPGGGFVFQQVHNVMADVPPQNVVALFKAVKEFNG